MLDFSHEQSALHQGYTHIVGIDEVGRGPWAGPVVAAAVLLDPNNLPVGATDSKKLTAVKRDVLFDEIMAKAHVGIGEASVEEIDELNILQATFVAMRRAVEALPVKPDFAFVDGRDVPTRLNMKAQSVIKGDGIVLSIACASIIAKVYRDRLMAQLGDEFPYYAWASNAGYGTKAHQEGLQVHGITQHHRKSFKPIKAFVEGV